MKELGQRAMVRSPKPTCLLCGGHHLDAYEEIQVDQIDALWKKQFGFSVASEFAGHERIRPFRCQACDLAFFYPALAGSARFYSQLQRYDWYYAPSKIEYTYARGFIEETDQVLDVGAGWGAFRNQIKSARYTGLELNGDAVKLAEERGINVMRESVEEHAHHARDTYDVVCLFQVLEHITSVQSFLQHCVACLKHAGLLIISVPSDDAFVAKAYNNVLNIPPHHVTRWSDRCLRNLPDSFRLQLVDLHHHAVEDVHVAWYAHTLGYNAIRDLLGMEYRLIDHSLANRVISAVSARLAGVLQRGLRDLRMRPRGHTVTVVYQKMGT